MANVTFKDADNTTQTGATKTVAGVEVAKVALTIGSSDSVATNAASGAGAVDSGTLRATLASDDPAVAQLGTIASALSAGKMSSASITRTADTNAYAANDVVGAATGSTAAIEFANVGVSGSAVVVTCAELRIDAASVISGETSYRLYLYGVTPPSALGDNAAFDLPSGDRASFLGFVDLGAPADLGSTLYVQALGVQKQLKLTATSLFGYLVTSTAHTPTASRVYTVTLHTSQV